MSFTDRTSGDGRRVFRVHRERAGLKSHFLCVFYGVLQIPTRGTLLKERLKMALRIVKKAKDKRVAVATKYGFVCWERV